MKCKYCGTVNNEAMKFCKYCGKELLNENISSSNKKSVFNRIIIALIVITIIAIVGMVSIIIFSKLDSSEMISDNKINTVENTFNETTIEDTNVDTENTTADVTVSRHENVIDEVDLFDDSELKYFDSSIDKYESDYNISVVLYINSVVEGDLPKFAQASCKNMCGENGVLIVVDYEDDEIAFGATGDGKKFIKNKNNSEFTKEINDYFLKYNYYNGCKEALDLLFDPVAMLGFERVQGADQVVYVKKDKKATTGKLTLVEWNGEDAEILYEIDKVYLGMEGITTSPSESKSATPAGTFKLGFAFSDHSLDTDLETELITSGAIWVNDPNSNYYNTLQYGKTKCSYWSSAEDTYAIFKGGYNDACILIEHNGNGYECGEKGKGSCIYIAGKNSGVSTSYGDVNITAKQMEQLLSYLDGDKNPYIVIS